MYTLIELKKIELFNKISLYIVVYDLKITRTHKGLI